MTLKCRANCNDTRGNKTSGKAKEKEENYEKEKEEGYRKREKGNQK